MHSLTSMQESSCYREHLNIFSTSQFIPPELYYNFIILYNHNCVYRKNIVYIIYIAYALLTVQTYVLGNYSNHSDTKKHTVMLRNIR